LNICYTPRAQTELRAYAKKAINNIIDVFLAISLSVSLGGLFTKIKRYLMEKYLTKSAARMRGNIMGMPPAKIIPTVIADRQLA
jgi:hypothetical protein